MTQTADAQAKILEGQNLWQKGDTQRACTCFESACQLDSENPEVWLTYASALMETQQFPEALPIFQNVLKLTPNHPEALYGLSLILEKQNRPREALECIQPLLTSEPNNPLWLESFGSLAFQAGLFQEAAETYRRLSQFPASDIDSDLQKDALNNLATIELALNQYDRAKQYFQDLLHREPNNLIANLGLADVHLNLNKSEEAWQAYQQVIQASSSLSKVEKDTYRVKQAMFLPVIYQSNDEIQQWRERLDAALRNLEYDPPQLLNPVKTVGRTPFYLPYQGYPDKGFQERLGRILQNSCDITSIPQYSGNKRKPENDKIRVGFISKYLQQAHTIGKVMWGIIYHLNRDLFEVVHLHLGEGLSTRENWPIPPEDYQISLPLWDTASASQQVLSCELDILVYCDIGMEPASYFLALSKLAPVQCVTWGHPITTGLNTMDAMISSRYFELEKPLSQTFYTESLQLLETLPSWYTPPEKKQIIPALNKNDFGFPDHQTLYSCPQSLYKIHPDFDPMIQGILETDANGHIVFFEGFHPSIHQSLLKRWGKQFSETLLKRIHFLPRTDASQFYSFLNCTDVMLDPIHFGGGNTSLEALSFGTPIITFPSQLMRGRFSQGFYQQMGVSKWIAQDTERYIQKACLLGQNKSLREEVRRSLQEKSKILYENKDVILAWEECFLSLAQSK